MWYPSSFISFIDRIFAIPIHDYQEDILDDSLTNERYNGNGKHATIECEMNWFYKTLFSFSLLTLQVPQATVHSSEVAEA